MVLDTRAWCILPPLPPPLATPETMVGGSGTLLRVDTSYAGWDDSDSNNNNNNNNNNNGGGGDDGDDKNPLFDITTSSVLWDHVYSEVSAGATAGGYDTSTKSVNEKQLFVQALGAVMPAQGPGLGQGLSQGMGGCCVVGVYGPPNSGKNHQPLHKLLLLLHAYHPLPTPTNPSDPFIQLVSPPF